MIDRDLAGRRHQQRVAVGRRLRDRACREHRARTRAVLDDDRLAERGLHRLLQQPRDDIDPAAGRVADKNMDRLARIVRLGASTRNACGKRGSPGEQMTSCQHSVSSTSRAIDELYLRKYFKSGR